jgi:hypothetical protein
MMHAHCLSRLRRSHHSKNLIEKLSSSASQAFPAMNADRHLATAAQRSQGGSLSSHRKPGCRMIEECNGRNRHCILLARLDA